jgi:phosphatidylserine/phosphatidylglycerophosphate/cardiolipin synthase-like enzyme
MRRVLFITIYLILLLLHVDFSPQQDVGDSLHTQAFFCQEINCVDFLITLLEQNPEATCVFYDIGEQRLLDYLSRSLHTVYLDEGNLDASMPDTFLPLKRPGLMHHKFCIFENTVLTGSWNPTERGTYLNDNYILLLSHPEIVRSFRKELRTLTYPLPTKPLQLQSDATSFSLYFCPEHNCEEKIVTELKTVTSSVDVLSFTFTSKPLATELLRLQNDTIAIRFLQEKRQSYLSTVEEDLDSAGAEVAYDTNPYTMHGKVWILDNHTLILGSYNPTKAATTKNDETLIFIRNDTALITAFTAEFERIWATREK